MKKSILPSLVAALACLAVLISCNSIDNGGGTDWAEVKMVINQPNRSATGGSRSVALSSGSALVSAVQASVDAVDADTDLTGAWDRQMMNITDGTVSLNVPLNESMRLAVQVFSDDYALAEALEATASSTGVSSAFTVDTDTTSKDVTVAMSGSGSGSGITWTPVDGDGDNGINRNPEAGDGGSPMLVSYDCGFDACASENGLYATWTENNGTQWQVRVAKWDGASSWSHIGGDDSSGINKDATNEARYPSLVSYSSRLYAIWREEYNLDRFARVAKWKDEAWQFVDTNENTGLAKDPNAEEENVDPKGVVFNDKLYVTWTETNGTASQVRVAEYDADAASPSFNFVDGDGSEGINKDPTRDGQEPFLEVVSSTLFITWHEKNASGVPNIRVAKWDGTSSWLFVDGDGADGINKNPAYQAGMPELLYSDNELYAIWSEVDANSVNQIRVAKWDQDDGWDFIDGGGDTGLNKDSTHWAYLPRAVAFNSKLYITWMETSDPNPDVGIAQVRVISYDGSGWSFVDGDEVTGLNRDVTKSAQVPSLAVHNEKLYLAWMENNGDTFQIRVSQAVTD